MIHKVTIKGEPIIEIYESFDGSYWYITEKLYKQDSVIDGKVYYNDQILFGYARLSMCPEYAEFGNISETELKLLGNRVWKVPKSNWYLCPEVKVVEAAKVSEGEIPSESLKSFSQSLKGGDRKMKFELQATIDSYVELLDKIRERANSSDAIAIMSEIRKDQRSKQMQEKKVMNGTLPATESQVNYLKKLGMTEIPEDLNRDQASQKIDELKDKVSYKRALKAPIRIP